MKRTLEQREYDFTNQGIALPEQLEELIQGGFRQEPDCLLWKNVAYFGPEVLSDFARTEYEDFENHIHVDDYIPKDADEFEYLAVGLESGKRIYKKILKTGIPFRILISFSETAYKGGEIEFYGSCVVRFYMVRSSCDARFRTDDLERFASEAVMVLE